jgi:DNA-binding transcriptional MerR regulator
MPEAGNYRVQEFARLAGVTVRALHHYDRIGLLRPRRNNSGSRVYSDSDLGRLEQIVALTFIGLPLKSIRGILSGDSGNLPCALHSQALALEEKRRLLDTTIAAIRDAEAELRADRKPNLKHIIEVMEMYNSDTWILKYFKEEVKAKVNERRSAWTPALQEQIAEDWRRLFRDTEAVIESGPASPAAQTLVERWERLIRDLVGGDLELIHGVKAMYAGRTHWPEDFRAKMAPFMDDRIWRFLLSAAAART